MCVFDFQSYRKLNDRVINQSNETEPIDLPTLKSQGLTLQLIVVTFF